MSFFMVFAGVVIGDLFNDRDKWTRYIRRCTYVHPILRYVSHIFQLIYFKECIAFTTGETLTQIKFDQPIIQSGCCSVSCQNWKLSMAQLSCIKQICFSGVYLNSGDIQGGV